MKDLTKIFVISLPLMGIFFIPRPPIGGSEYLLYPFLVAMISVLILDRSSVNTNLFGFNYATLLLVVLLFQSFFVGISQTMNVADIRFLSSATIFKPITFAVVFYSGFLISRKYPSFKIKQVLYVTASIIVVGQFIISFTQAFGFDYLSIIYQSDKARSISGIFRVTGSVGNPNILALFMTQAILIILLFGNSRFKYLIVFLAFLVIMSTGSRSVLILFPLVMGLYFFIIKERSRLYDIIKVLIYSLLLFSVIIYLIVTYSDYFNYLSELLIIFQGGDLFTSIRSISNRFYMWEVKWSYFLLNADTFRWLFGFGSIPQFRVADNDYLYALFNFGVIGLLMNLVVYVAMITMSILNNDKQFRAVLIPSIFMLVVLGFQVETLSGWLQPLTTFYILGLSVHSKMFSRFKSIW